MPVFFGVLGVCSPGSTKSGGDHHYSHTVSHDVICSVKLGLAVEVFARPKKPREKAGLAQLEGNRVQAGVQRYRLCKSSASPVSLHRTC